MTDTKSETVNNAFCPSCGAYIPTESDVCLSCGKPRRLNTEPEGDYLFFQGEKIPIYVAHIEAVPLAFQFTGRCEDGEMRRDEIKYYRKFEIIESKPSGKLF